ncbi:MAG: glycosyltransferase family 9 protein, partial [Candidatus Omnitrophica bacterium]|nr:glycosyltransferase family 9 protein [Candidatus Omnitrophota bacterium]
MQRIIVRAPNWIGDAVLITPALTFLRKKFPVAHIAVLAKEWTRDVFKANPSIDEIITLNKSILRISREIRQKQFEMGLLFPHSFSSALLFFIAGIPQRIGYPTDGRSLLLTKRVKRSSNFKKEHQVIYFLRLVQEIGYPPSDVEYPLNEIGLVWIITDEEKEKADLSLRNASGSRGWGAECHGGGGLP